MGIVPKNRDKPVTQAPAARRASGSIPPLPQQNSTEGIADGDAERFLESIRPLQRAAAAGAAAAEAARIREETLRRSGGPPGAISHQKNPPCL
jgi:hypothetical protein